MISNWMARGAERLRAERAEQREKNQITIVSVLAAIALTVLKLVVGVLTGSLGLLAEAAHSGLDAFATILTFFSVRIAGRPADANHPYGHGRFENLSATIQGLLLLGTSAWIIYESIRRLFFVTVEVEPSAWAFLVMGGSIATDLWRSNLLLRAARKYHSRALEADALNFRADMFSASVVILGLALTTYAELTGTAGWLARADALAALVVACVIIYMSGKLALAAINTLLDLAPEELAARMTRAVAQTPGVLRTHTVRLRESGSRLFADVTVGVPRTSSLEQAHAISERVEAAVRAIEPRTETVVHVEPEVSAAESASERIRAVAQRLGLQTHHEQLYVIGEERDGRADDGLEASLHLEVAPQLTLAQAHAFAHQLAAALKEAYPEVRRVNTHIEVDEPDLARLRPLVDPAMARTIRDVVVEAGVGASCHEVRLYRALEAGGASHAGEVAGVDRASDGVEGRGDGAAASTAPVDVVLHCDFPPGLRMGAVHLRTEQIELLLRERLPQVGRVVIHAEPRVPSGTA